MMRSYIGKYLALGLCLLSAYLADAQGLSYQPDLLGDHYEFATLDLPRDYSGEVVATLIRRQPRAHVHRAILYIHGYNDYFFQAALGDSIAKAGYNFYALDLRKYGRSIRAGQRPFECRDVREYQPEIALALEAMRREGQTDVYLMAHSTGGLIASLYLHDTKNRDGIRGLILNSPFVDYNSTKCNERILLPLVTSMAWLAPNMVIIPAGREGAHYAHSLLAEYHGKWDYRKDWKMPQGYPIRASWLRAIKRGHRRLQAGLDIQIPVLLMSSAASTLPSKDWQDSYGKVDLVLDVEDMWRYGGKIAREVHFAKIADGLHDLFLSSDDEARNSAYATLFFWLKIQEKRRETPQTTIVESSEQRPDLVGKKADIISPILY